MFNEKESISKIEKKDFSINDIISSSNISDYDHQLDENQLSITLSNEEIISINKDLRLLNNNDDKASPYPSKKNSSRKQKLDINDDNYFFNFDKLSIPKSEKVNYQVKNYSNTKENEKLKSLINTKNNFREVYYLLNDKEFKIENFKNNNMTNEGNKSKEKSRNCKDNGSLDVNNSKAKGKNQKPLSVNLINNYSSVYNFHINQYNSNNTNNQNNQNNLNILSSNINCNNGEINNNNLNNGNVYSQNKKSNACMYNTNTYDANSKMNRKSNQTGRQIKIDINSIRENIHNIRACIRNNSKNKEEDTLSNNENIKLINPTSKGNLYSSIKHFSINNETLLNNFCKIIEKSKRNNSKDSPATRNKMKYNIDKINNLNCISSNKNINNHQKDAAAQCEMKRKIKVKFDSIYKEIDNFSMRHPHSNSVDANSNSNFNKKCLGVNSNLNNKLQEAQKASQENNKKTRNNNFKQENKTSLVSTLNSTKVKNQIQDYIHNIQSNKTKKKINVDELISTTHNCFVEKGGVINDKKLYESINNIKKLNFSLNRNLKNFNNLTNGAGSNNSIKEKDEKNVNYFCLKKNNSNFNLYEIGLKKGISSSCGKDNNKIIEEGEESGRFNVRKNIFLNYNRNFYNKELESFSNKLNNNKFINILYKKNKGQ